MAIVNEDKLFYLNVRHSVLEIMIVCLRMYKKTGKEKFVNQGKEFGIFSEQLKKKIKSL